MKWKLAAALATLPAILALGACSGEPAPSPVESSAPAMPDLPVVGEQVTILAIGDSLFAGYGVEPGQSYPVRLETALRARGINAVVVNAGVSGDTTAGGLQRLDFVLNGMKTPPALVIISLGGNDMLRGLPPQQTRQNLDALLTKLDQRKVPAMLMGMLAAPNWGAEQAGAFNAIYPDLARKHGAKLVPFFLQAVIDKPQLIQADRVHPTAQGLEEIVAATVNDVAKALPVSPVASPAPR
ncbi:MAG: arylesterase [Sphingomonadales bacterium]|nr:arylesterase [Sphingomonadales bacterium]